MGRIEYLNLLSYDEDDLLGALAARLMTGRRPMHSSPRYAKSDWCRREFEEFCKNAEAGSGLRLGDKSRVFKVVKTPVNPVELPPGMKALYETILGFEFYDLDPETGASGRATGRTDRP